MGRFTDPCPPGKDPPKLAVPLYLFVTILLLLVILPVLAFYKQKKQIPSTMAYVDVLVIKAKVDAAFDKGAIAGAAAQMQIMNTPTNERIIQIDQLLPKARSLRSGLD